MGVGRCAVLVAAYNAAETLGPLLEDVRRHFTGDLILVDDGSTDATGDIGGNLANVVLSHDTNRGKGAALITGFTHLIGEGYQAVVTLDADGQHLPEFIPRFIEMFERTGCDLVLGRREFSIRTTPFLRYFGNVLSSFWISIISGVKVKDSQCGFRLYRLEAIQTQKLATSGFDTETELLFQIRQDGGRIEQVDIPLIYKAGGKSNFKRIWDTLAVTRVIVRHLLNWRRCRSGRGNRAGRSLN
ncbi:MAG: glycosyltransferase family 2 protein [Candidatus Coatesbacteria bacterium]|nr:glycosyltransferase family 2 protein [Candidatus Coatesbacteria bacterium]